MVAQTPQLAGPLACLASRLRPWPTSVSGLINILGQCESYLEFAGIVKSFLPEHQAEILSHAHMEDQVASFAAHFQERYFPLYPGLADGMIEEYEQVTMGIPAEPHGISYECYYDLSDLRPGLLVMTSLIDMEFEGRILLLEECKKHLPAGLLESVRPLPLKQMEDLLQNTRFEGLIRWARIWDHSTGFYFLDATDEDGWEPIDWTEENVRWLKNDWDQSLAWEEPAYRFGEWIEKDVPKHFKEMIDFIGKRRHQHEF